MAVSVKSRQIRVKVGMMISFTYKKLDGDWRNVNNFLVDNIFVSKSGQRIIQGWREDGTGHSYRRYRMSNVVEVKPKEVAS
jgi:hypothetical protein